MAKAASRKTSESKRGEGSATASRSGQMTSGADTGDNANVGAADNKADGANNTKAGANAPDAKATTKAKQKAAEELFHDADKDGNPTPESVAARRSALGY